MSLISNDNSGNLLFYWLSILHRLPLKTASVKYKTVRDTAIQNVQMCICNEIYGIFCFFVAEINVID